MKKIALLFLLVTSSSVMAGVLAFLSNSYTSTSVTGRSVWICIYAHGNQKFERIIPLESGPCPVSIEIQ